MAHAMKVLRHDIEPGIGKEVVDVGDAPVKGIFDRYDAKICFAAPNRLDRIVEGGLRNGQCMRRRLASREIGIGPRLALEGDALCCRNRGSVCHVARGFARVRLASSRSAGVSTLKGTLSTRATAIRMP